MRTDEYWLTVDFQIQCSQNGYPPINVLLPSIVLTALIPIGIPVAMYWKLVFKKKDLQTSQSQTRKKYAFFVKDYKLKCCPWLLHTLPGNGVKHLQRGV